jgi:cytochrome c biogenesis protein CcdA
MRDVFIAHVEEDADIALEVVLGLEEVGYTTWCYEVDSIPGQSYLIQTGKAVEDSRVAVVVISPHSLGSRQVTREVVRAHESGKEFIPVLRGITHVEFQNRQPEWREAIGAAASISIPREGVARVIPRIIDGLKSLGILPTSKTNAARIVQIRETLAEIRGGDVGEKAEELPTRAKRIEARAVTVGKPPTISGWFWAAIALLCLGFLLLIIATIAYPSPINPQQPWYEYFFGILIIAILFIVPGVYCLRRGMSQATVAKPSQGKIPSWWWLWPIILAFVGGIISWAKQKDVDWRKAANMLTLGIVLSLFWTIPFLVLQASVVPSASLESPASAPITLEEELPVAVPETSKTETPVPSPGLLYEDDFSDRTSGWSRTSKDDYDMDYGDGEYHILVKKSFWTAWAFNTETEPFADFVLEVDANLLTEAVGDTGYGLIFRVQNDDNFYYFGVSKAGYAVGAKVDGKWVDWQRTTSAYSKEGNDMNHLKVLCKGSEIEVYVNGQHLTTVTDHTLSEGWVGMIVDTSGAPNARAVFDNMKVYSLTPEAP